ncbi:SipW-dependent-type signal peptide-containing protein [Arthrobacter cupressi]|uniref:SipW-cognate class signal peptide n=1 Tax=Arthrobacter cupressi TaxID=1045773 RepID=A0A1G8QLF5_9MICC|nr:SipW-dependent-type signal peptide-containing protein [Arthrobacter cupressi]NYD78182.1 putative ribosomally synthesized peptide with SipW-like signal peptide [Arthrobacter cupressi]SDJ05496.1 SipW-cognate class signal peptide [Arthrobacter cupressi]
MTGQLRAGHLRTRPRSTPRTKLLRVRALLAGGLVLGAGATMTLAAWNDSEFATGTFSASSFALQSSTDSGGTWQEHGTSATAATMSFTAGGMSPGAVNYAPIWLRTVTGSVSGTLELQGGQVVQGGDASLFAAFDYRVVRYSSGSCDASQFGAGSTYIVGSSSSKVALGTAGAGTAVAANAASPVQLCFEITMKTTADNSLQGTSSGAVWEIKGTSDS